MNTQDEVYRSRIEEHLPMARRIAGSMSRRLPSSVPREDIEGAAFLGLTEAAIRYDAGRCDNFGAYAMQRIRGAILDELRRCDLMPRRCREQAKRIERATREAGNSGPATSERVAEVLGMSVAELDQQRYRFQAPTIAGLDQVGELASPCTDVVNELEERRRAAAVKRAIAALGERDRAILNHYYVESRSQKEIGAALGVSESRVCQLRKRAEKTVRRLVEACAA